MPRVDLAARKEYVREYNQRPHAKEAAREQSRRVREATPELVRERHRQWKANHPERMRDAQQRHREKVRDDPAFRAAAAERTREWRRLNPDKAHRANVRKKAMKAGVAHSPYLRADIIARDGGICYLCNTPVPTGQEHLDHVIPISRGGPDSADNVRVTHPACNMRKHANLLP